MLPQKIAFVDLETTGTSAQHDRIIEVGILRVENGVITDTFSSLLNPQTHIPPYITTITGIRTEDVSNAPTFYDVENEITRLLDDCIFVAHNVRFDYSFLKHEYARIEKRFSKRHFCTVRLSRILYPTQKKHNLDSIIERFNIPCTNRHRALDDASVLATFYETAKNEIPESIFTSAVAKALKQPTLPSGLAKEDITNLPEAPGVYLFYGENNMPLYIGKSINIRDRVLSHFSSDITSHKEMNIARQIHSIKFFETAGELGALFLESKLIKEHLPLYNRRLRYTRELVVLMEQTDKDGYKTVSLSHLNALYAKDLQDSAGILGIFRSKKDAKTFLTTLAKEYELCEKLLGLEKTKTGCFASRLNICKGACEKHERTLFYNLRFTTAFSKNRLSPWPFKGPIIITEQNSLSGMTEKFLFDNWCLYGNIQQKSDAESVFTKESMQFDLDMYKILISYLRTKKYGISIQDVTHEDLTMFTEDSPTYPSL